MSPQEQPSRRRAADRRAERRLAPAPTPAGTSALVTMNEPPRALADSAGGGGNLGLVLWRRKWIVVAALLLSLGGGYALLRRIPPSFTCSGVLHVLRGGPSVLADGSTGGGGSDTGEGFFYVQTQLFYSPAFLADVAADPALADVPAFANDPQTARLGRLRGGVRADSDEAKGILTVGFQSPDPAESQRVAALLMDHYAQANSDQRQESMRGQLEVLQDRKSKSDAELAAANEAVADFRRDNRALSFEKEDRGNLIFVKLEELSGALTQAEFDVQRDRLNLRAAEAVGDDPAALAALGLSLGDVGKSGGGTGLISGGDAENARLAVAAARQRLDRLESFYGKNQRDYATAKADLEAALEAQKQVARLAARTTLDVLRRKTELSESRRGELADSFAKQQALAEDYNAKAADYALLRREVERVTKINDSLDTSIKQLQVELGPTTVRITRLREPEAAAAVKSPDPRQILGISGVLGVALGVLGAMLAEWGDRGLRTAGQVGEQLRLPILGVVPQIRGGRSRTDAARVGRTVIDDPGSAAAQAWSAVQAAVHFRVPGRPRMVVVTSPQSGEGKSVTAANVALSAARGNLRVLLVDADLRNSSLHTIFPPVAAAAGLGDVLADHVSPLKAVSPTAEPLLDVVYAQRVGEAPLGQTAAPLTTATTVAPRRLKDVLSRLAKGYDYIVVDAPPALLTGDAMTLAGVCRNVILVARLGRSQKDELAGAVERLRGVNAGVLGAVVNGARDVGEVYYGGTRPPLLVGDAPSGRGAARARHPAAPDEADGDDFDGDDQDSRPLNGVGHPN